MSIIFIDDLIFIQKDEEVFYNLSSCLYFIILNTISIFCTSFFIFFYYKMPNYQNNPNSLTLYLILIQGLLCFFYLLFFIQIYFFTPKLITMIMKISGTFNPIIIFCSYLWNSFLTHNIYISFYNYKTNIDKRIKLYKYQLLIFTFIIYLLTNFNLDFHNNDILNNNFSFTYIYSDNFIILLSLIYIGFIIYIISRLYYIFKKNTEYFSLNIDNMRENTIKQIFTSLIQRYILYICYFIICFFPSAFCMIIKEIFDYRNIQNYQIDFITLSLISFNPTFILLVKSTDPIMKSFIWKIITCSKIEKKIKEKPYKNLIELSIFNESKSKLVSLNSPEDLNISHISPFKEKNLMNESYEFNLEGKNDYFKFPHKKINETGSESGILIPMNIIINKLNKSKDLNLNLNPEFNSSSNDLTIKKQISTIQYQNPKKEMLIINKIKTENNINSFRKKLLKKKTTNLEYQNKFISNDSLNKIFQDEKSIKSNESKNLSITSKRDNSYTKSLESLSNISKTGMIGLSPFDLMYYHLELDDNLLRMMAISISLNFDRKYDNNLKYKNYFNSTLPWKEQFFYKEKSYWKEFNEKNIPDWLSVKNDDRFKKFHFKIKTYCSFVFHHIRTIDKVSIDYLIESLDPVKNLSYLNKLKVSGGRGDNSILSTYNKKFIIKTINKEEKNILNKMLKAYHKRLKDTKSILCRIYGLYKIELEDKGKIHIILQRNMDSLPEETKLLTFDLKGSTVDRQSINKIDEKLKSNLLMKKYKNKVLKDVDLKILKLNFMLDTNEALNLIKSIKNDSEFLERYEVTDYSLLVFVHKYRQNDININLINSGVMKSYDKKYLFEFSIIDFLGTFNFIKKSEKLAKTFVGYIKQMKDTNFSVLDPERYGLRLRNFVEKIIPINLENDTD